MAFFMVSFSLCFLNPGGRVKVLTDSQKGFSLCSALVDFCGLSPL